MRPKPKPTSLANLRSFAPGQGGRPKGSRNKLGEEFLRALHDDFEQHGADVIAQVRETRPHEYLKIVASILPKELKVDRSFSDLSDDELNDRIRQLARACDLVLAEPIEDEPDDSAPAGTKPH